MRKRPVVNFLQIASLVMLLVAVALLAAITTMHFAIHGAEVQVPALQGMTVADARSETAGLGLNLDVDNRYYSGDVAAGHILTQSPAAGTVVRREWRVRVAESLGPQRVDVPETVGKDARVAALTLRRVGLEVGTTAHIPWSQAVEGTVLAQDPPAHAQGISRPSVNLLVAAPDDEAADGFVMPDLTGLPVVAAQAQLAKVGIQPGTPKYVAIHVAPVGSGDAPPTVPVRPGSVIAQTPTAGSRVVQSVVVTLTVAQ
jgi:beta-lactam-binding protein with PASTA domain